MEDQEKTRASNHTAYDQGGDLHLDRGQTLGLPALALGQHLSVPLQVCLFTRILRIPPSSSSFFTVYLPSSGTLPDVGASAQHDCMSFAPNAHDWTLNILLLVFPFDNVHNIGAQN